MQLGWLPTVGQISVLINIPHPTNFYLVDALLAGNLGAFWDVVQHLILPAVALGSIPLAMITRITRAAVLDVQNEDYIRTARAKGLPPRIVDLRHVLRNALLPVSTIVGLQVGLLLSGAILTETVFAYPGIGSWLRQAISDRNYPVIQGGILFVAVAAYYEQYSFGIQHEISKDFALEANYIGTLGRKLIGILNRNTYDGRTSGVPNAFGVSSSVRPNPIFNSDNARGNFYSSNYNALDLTLRKRFSNGLSFNANYTYAKSLDQLSDVFRSRTAQISATDVENVHYDYGPSDFDVRHRVVVSYNYDLPFFKANRWVGGWALNGIFSWNTGAPVAIFDNNNDVNHDGVFTDRPTYAAGTDVLKSILGKEQAVAGVGNVYQYLDPTQFASTTCPATVNGGFWCNSTLSRNSVPGPKFTNWDFGVSKGFKITENTKLRFDANFFNLFNHPNFQNPQNNFSDPAFGQSQSTYGDTGGHRVTQLALRFDF